MGSAPSARATSTSRGHGHGSRSRHFGYQVEGRDSFRSELLRLPWMTAGAGGGRAVPTLIRGRNVCRLQYDGRTGYEAFRSAPEPFSALGIRTSVPRSAITTRLRPRDRTAVSLGNLGSGYSSPLTASTRAASPDEHGRGRIPIAEWRKHSTPKNPGRCSVWGSSMS